MRLVNVLVPDEKRTLILDALDDEGVDYVVLSEGSGSDRAVVQFPLPTPAVEEVLERLSETGLDDEYIVVSSAETAQTGNFADLENRFSSRDTESIASLEIRSRVLEMEQGAAIYYTMTILSAVVAAAGLLLDSAAIVVGSMVIAPQVGAAMKASVGAVLNDREMIVTGLRSQALGLGLAVASAAAFGWFLQTLGTSPTSLSFTTIEQLNQRVSPGVLSLTVAVVAGFAGAFSLATAVSTALVGVMIAAALIPAAAAVGIGIAWNVPAVALGAGVLLVINTASVNLTGIAGLWVIGYRPGTDTYREDGSLPAARQLRSGLAALVVLAAVFAGSGYVAARHVTFEKTATETVESVVAQSEYEELELVSVQVQFRNRWLSEGTRGVTVVVRRPADTEYPELAEAIQRRLTARTDGRVAVEVEFVDTETPEVG